MKKLLTISIAAYNVEQYITQTLESLVKSKHIDKLEVFVIDDGSQDGTLSVAQKYQKKYPNSIFAIHKNNGGYGSTVNVSIKNASGKYFKLLDGDDWFQTDQLDNLLERLEYISTDIVVTNYTKYIGEENKQIVNFPFNPKNEEINIEKAYLPIIGMWGLCYKTDILRNSQLLLPEHTLYTDQLFATIPFGVAKTIIFFDFPVYCYRLGRDGQSVSRESRIKNINQNIFILEKMIEFYEGNKNLPNISYILRRVSASYINILKTYFLFPTNKETLKRLKDFEKKYKTLSPEIYNMSASFGRIGMLVKFFRVMNYWPFWFIKLLPNGFPNWA